MAFQLAATGKSDREVAKTLNAAGYRTAGNQGNLRFSKDTVRGLLTNRFYLGEISNGNGGWLRAQHAPFVPLELFEAARMARERNRRNPAGATRADAQISSLPSVARCVECGATLRTMRNRGIARMVCDTRLKRGGCSQKSARLDVYEAQLQDYLEAFQVPEDYQQMLVDAQRRLALAYDDTEAQRRRLERAQERLTDLYKWGDIDRGQYRAQSSDIEEELSTLRAPSETDESMERLAQFLRDVASGWSEASQKQRNKLARSLFESVWIEDQGVLGVTPRPELKPFFELQYAGLSNDVLQVRPRPDSNRRSSA